jgi:hypothetical protein
MQHAIEPSVLVAVAGLGNVRNIVVLQVILLICNDISGKIRRPVAEAHTNRR